MSHNCLICNGDLKSWKNFEGLVQCRECSFISSDLDLSEAELKTYYEADYFHGKEYDNYTRDIKIIQSNFKNRLKTLKRFITPSQQTLFEIGCAYGYFLDLAQKELFRASGIDISAVATTEARDRLSVNAISGNFLEIDIPPYDICCLWDTIEHLKYPDLFIKKIYKEMSTGGILALTTGDIGSLNARLRGRRWRQIHLPTHLHYFSIDTMKKFLISHGFEIIHVSHPGNVINLETICYMVFVLRNDWERIYFILKKTKLLQLNIYINLLDTMYVIAKKH